MLKRIYIKNNATVKELEILPGEGLNILTGETGAGKSVIINTLSLILGARTDTSLVRYNCEKLLVEAEFILSNYKDLQEYLKNHDLSDDLDPDLLVIRRIITTKGRSRAFVNDNPVKLEVLKELGNKLVDLHGQHDHQSLLKKEMHQQLVDRFADNSKLLNDYQNIFLSWQDAEHELTQLIKDSSMLQEKLDLYNYHLKEITAVSPEQDEDKEVDKELKIMEKAEDIKKYADSADQLVYQSSFLDVYQKLSKICTELEENDENFKTYYDDLESSRTVVEDFIAHLSGFASEIEFDEERFNYLNQRYSDLKLLMKKFGPDLKDVLLYQEKIEEELAKGSNTEIVIEDARKKVEILKKDVLLLGGELARKRKTFGEIFCKKVNEEFHFLDLNGAKLKLIQKENECTLSGLDKLEFMIKTNSGSPFGTLSKIASGGEISRIMLAIKCVLSNSEGVPVLVFDEIDTGISGQTAAKVAVKISELANSRQIFSITHLPLIAAKGNQHFKVEKFDDGQETETRIKELNTQQKIKELARMSSGDEENDAALANARNLLQ